MRRCISAAIAFVALVAFLAACEGRDLPVVLLPSPAPALAFTDPAPTRTAPPPTPTVSPMPTTTPAPDFTTPLPQPTLSAEEMAVIYRLSPEEQEEVRYAYWLETTTDRWAAEVMNPATQEHSHALLRKDYDAFCAVAVADPGPLRAELDARRAPSSLEDAHRYAAVIVDPIERSADCGRVARAFVDAPMEGDARIVRALSASDAGIDRWMTTRRGVSCPFSWDDETSTGLVCKVDEREASEKWSCGFSCACVRRDYYFSIQAVELQQTPEGGRVTYWSEPHESDLP